MAGSSSSNTSKGKKGEELAVQFLEKEGYTIVCKNYRFSRSEIDIISRKDRILIFIEVKLRYYGTYGLPEQSVNSKKEKLIRVAAENYIFETDWKNDIRFDIVAIEFINGKYVITHLKDVF